MMFSILATSLPTDTAFWTFGRSLPEFSSRRTHFNHISNGNLDVEVEFDIQIYINKSTLCFPSSSSKPSPSLSPNFVQPPGRKASLLHKQPVPLVPLFYTILSVLLMHALLPLRPSHPGRLRVCQDTNHLVRHGQIGIDCRGKRVDQFRPLVIPQPEHRTAVGTEVALGRAQFLRGFAAIFDGSVFSSVFEFCRGEAE